ncbi:flagellar protein FlbD [Desulfosporosinus fructosivorans]|uniref:Flagellar protein FlbD n=1 Tax=Desulfosporosinus fructosivorans TaxID=2018669 RepID=A0A4Z0RAW3_9FIRM|nr:flagellar FlbD family protein [Desulfosporosinus fructosivorans]TGE39988.1 flagellar protein FlbD [Desulfosporosinus fructosivorans]
MINVTRLNHKIFTVNSDLIEMMEETPDTVITLTGGNKFVVLESVEVLVERIIEFRRRCHPIIKLEERLNI